MPDIEFITLETPVGFDRIIAKLSKKNWLVSYLNATKEEVYNPTNYHYNSQKKGINYEIILDRNILSFVVSAVKKTKAKAIYREAISLIAFCQIANINIEPNIAVYEKIFSENGDADEAVEELMLFYKINNAAHQSTIRYSLGQSNHIELYEKGEWNYQELKEKLTSHKWLTEWKSMYLIVLNIVRVHLQNDSNYRKFEDFISWMIKDFRLSQVCIIYAVFLFSSKRMKKMMKYDPRSPRNEQIKQLNNMT